MEDRKVPEKVDYFVHEGIMVRQERTIKRLWILCIIIFVALILTNGGWLWYESQWQDEVITQEISQDSGEGGNVSFSGRMIGGDYDGEADDTTDSEKENP